MNKYLELSEHMKIVFVLFLLCASVNVSAQSKYSIVAPDGRTYNVTGPPGATRDEVISRVREQYPYSNITPKDLAAGVTPQSQQDDATCKSYGFEPKTQGFAECKQRLDMARRQPSPPAITRPIILHIDGQLKTCIQIGVTLDCH